MSFQLFIRPEVESDLKEAATWYEERESGLGRRFVRETRSAFKRIVENPLLFRVRHKRLHVRWTFPKNFPYRIVFVVENDTIIILCVVHAKRRDRAWRERL